MIEKGKIRSPFYGHIDEREFGKLGDLAVLDGHTAIRFCQGVNQ